ncbi:MAG TPA: PLP-dependent lyase/thiolase [Candidatus Paceibacterota bacterium]
MASLTPLENYKDLATAIGCDDVLFKREDLHPYGSHKGRSIPVMIEHYVEAGDRRFAISSSGNAAFAAGLYVQEYNANASEPVELDIFIGNHIAPHKADKLKTLADDHIRVIAKERPRQAVLEAEKEGARSLRQSLDDEALIGYESLGAEIMSDAKNAGSAVGAIFIGTSSGTTAQALAQYFADKDAGIQVHIVQTSSCHPMSQEFESYDGPDEQSIADAIVDIVATRKPSLVPAINTTGGHGWTVTNQDIQNAQEMVFENTGLEISTNSALSVAGLITAVEVGWEMPGVPVCLICGD